jgi:hypothetical protein
MIAQVLRTSPGGVTGVLLIAGFVLTFSDAVPVKLLGGACILLAFLVPFVTLSLDANKPAGSGTSRHDAARRDPTQDPISAATRDGSHPRRGDSSEKPSR